jgi:hypothetical protein
MFRNHRRNVSRLLLRGFIPAIGALTLGALVAGGAAADSHPDQLAGNGRPTRADANIATTTTLSLNPNPVTLGGPLVSANVSVTPASGTVAPPGSVKIVQIVPGPSGNIDLCTATLTTVVGTATNTGGCTFAPTAAGTFQIRANYNSPALSGFANSTTNPTGNQTLTVNKGTVAVFLAAVTGPRPKTGQPYSPVATVIASDPLGATVDGNVTISDDATPTANSCVAAVTLGQATCQLPGTTAGLHTLTAVYNGSNTFNNAAAVTAPQTIDPGDTTTTISSITPAGPVTGQPFAVTAAVAPVAPAVGTPGGTIAIIRNDTSATLCTITLPATSCNVTGGLPHSGSPYALHAHYGGDTNFNASNSGDQQLIVDKGDTTTAVTVSGDRNAGGSFSLNVVVAPVAPAAGVPTGTVKLMDDAGHQCTITLSGGAGSCTLRDVEAGRYTFHAYYLGDANFNGSVRTLRTLRIHKPPCGAITDHPYCDERGEDPR